MPQFVATSLDLQLGKEGRKKGREGGRKGGRVEGREEEEREEKFGGGGSDTFLLYNKILPFE